MTNYRQGDIYLKRIDSLPSGLKEKDKVLAYGEITGHRHRFESDQALVFADEKGEQYVKVLSDAALVHEEHDTHVVQEGLYRVVRQRELDLLGHMRTVMD